MARKALLLVLLTIVSACRAPATPTAAPTTAEAEIVSGNATLHAWSRGGSDKSPVLVLINGGPGLSHESMDPLQQALASPSLRVLTYDQRGVGRSVASGTEPFKPEEYVEDLEALRRHTGRERIHLLGHSFGGMVALSYLDRYPDRVASMILVGTGVSDSGVMQRSGARLAARIDELQKSGIIPDPIPKTASCSEKFAAVGPAYLADPKKPMPEVMRRRTCDASGRSSVLFPFIETSYRAGVETATAPVLVIYGERDPFGPEPSRYAASILKKAAVEVAELPACGHLGWLECEDAFLARIQSFGRPKWTR
jgi:proline iminopeptidase